MKLVREINFFDDKEVQVKLTWMSLAIILCFLILLPVFLFIIYQFSLSHNFNFKVDFPTFIRPFIILIIAVPLHEIIHGVFFKIFKPEAKIKLGFEAGMFYASAEGVTLSKRQFMIVVLAPLVLITLAIAIYAFISCHFTSAYLAIALHTMGCAGDLYYVQQLLRHSETTHIKDTSVGAEFYQELH